MESERNKQIPGQEFGFSAQFIAISTTEHNPWNAHTFKKKRIPNIN